MLASVSRSASTASRTQVTLESGQSKEFHVAQGEFRHVLLTVVTFVGDDQGFLKAKALELYQGVLNGYDVQDITGLHGKSQRLALLDGV